MNNPNIVEVENVPFLNDNDFHQYHHYQNEDIIDIHQYNHEYRHCLFENMSFQESSFENSFFIDVIIKNCDLSNISFHSTLFRRVHFINCKLLGSDFSESIFDDVYVKDCHCTFINLAYMKNKIVCFDNCDLRNGSIINVDLKKTTFHECHFEQCEVLHSSFYNIDLSSCFLDNIITTPEDIKGAIIDPYQASSLIHLLSIKIKQ